MMAWEQIHFDDTYPDGLGLGWLDTSDAYILSDRNRGFLDTASPSLPKAVCSSPSAPITCRATPA